MIEKPVVSVLMPVYNGEEYLREAIDSILKQSFEDFELLILLEFGSNPESERIIYSYKDERIKIIKNTSKMGLAKSLNIGIEEAVGEYIARMDADDVSYPNRLEKEVKYLDSHSDITICGSSFKLNGREYIKKPYKYEEVRFMSYFSCPFAHPTVMWKKKEFTDHQLWYRENVPAEDYELWTRALELVKGVNLQEPLLMYRWHKSNHSVIYHDDVVENDLFIKKLYWNRLGISYDLESGFESDSLTQEEIQERERLMLLLCRNLAPFSCRNRIVENMMYNNYMDNLPLRVCSLYMRYWNTFADLYEWKGIARLRICLFTIYRVAKRRIRMILRDR